MANSVTSSLPINNAPIDPSSSNDKNVKPDASSSFPYKEIQSKTQNLLHNLQTAKQKRAAEQKGILDANMEGKSKGQKFVQIFKNILLKLTDPSKDITKASDQLFGSMANAIVRGGNLSGDIAALKHETDVFQTSNENLLANDPSLREKTKTLDRMIGKLQILQEDQIYKGEDLRMAAGGAFKDLCLNEQNDEDIMQVFEGFKKRLADLRSPTWPDCMETARRVTLNAWEKMENFLTREIEKECQTPEQREQIKEKFFK